MFRGVFVRVMSGVRRAPGTFGAILVVLSLLGAPPTPAHAGVQPDPAVIRLIRVMMTEGGTAPPAAVVNEAYDLLAKAVGYSARALSHPRAISGAVNAELGAVMMESPAVRRAAQEFFRDMPGHSIHAVRTYLGRLGAAGIPAVQSTIVAEVPEQFTIMALDTAYAVSQSGGGAALKSAIHGEIRAGLAGQARSALSRLLGAVGSKFGAMAEWLASKTGQRILGIYAIADFTQSQINEALFAYQDEMEALGDAAELEAFNNNLNLMLDSLEDGRTVLVEGMTLAEAVRKLRRNMNRGGKYFDGILVKAEPGAGTGGFSSGGFSSGGSGSGSGGGPVVADRCDWTDGWGSTCICDGAEADRFECELEDAFDNVFKEYNRPPEIPSGD